MSNNNSSFYDDHTNPLNQICMWLTLLIDTLKILHLKPYRAVEGSHLREGLFRQMTQRLPTDKTLRAAAEEVHYL